jgi:hypothetical protein
MEGGKKQGEGKEESKWSFLELKSIRESNIEKNPKAKN